MTILFNDNIFRLPLNDLFGSIVLDAKFCAIPVLSWPIQKCRRFCIRHQYMSGMKFQIVKRGRRKNCRRPSSMIKILRHLQIISYQIFNIILFCFLKSPGPWVPLGPLRMDPCEPPRINGGPTWIRATPSGSTPRYMHRSRWIHDESTADEPVDLPILSQTFFRYCLICKKFWLRRGVIQQSGCYTRKIF